MDLLICNGVRLELDKENPFPMDFSIMDLLEPEKRQRNRSKTIIFPGVKSNCNFFYSVFDIHLTGNVFTFDATQKASVQYYKNGVLIGEDWILRLKEVTLNDGNYSFTAEIYGESIDIFLLLNDINVADLDWSDYDHTLSRANIIASWSTASGSGYRYPLIERGNGRVAPTIWNTTDVLPYVHVREVIYKMFEYLGVTINSTFLDTDRAKDILWGYGGGDYISQSISPADVNDRLVDIDTGDFNYTTNGVMSGTNTLYSGAFSGGIIGYEQTYNFLNRRIVDGDFTYSEVQDNLDQYDNGRTVIARSGNYLVESSGVFQLELSGGNTLESFGSVGIRLIKNGATLYYPLSQFGFLTQTSATTWEFDYTLSNTFYFQSGDEIELSLDCGFAKYSRLEGEALVALQNIITTLTDVIFKVTSIDSAVTDGSDILIGKFLPDMKCSEFLLGAIRQFYITTTDPDIDGIINFEPLIDFYQDTDQFEDISTLIDEKKDILIRPSANDFAKNHVFMYKDNKDYDNVNYFELYGNKYGDYTFTQGSFYSKGENKIELPWSNIVPYDISNGILVPRFITIDNNGAIKGNKGNSRIMMWNGLKSGTWTFRNTDDPTSYQVLTTYPCVHHFDDWESPTFDLNFQLVERVFYTATIVTTTNCYSEYYSTFINEITSPLGRIIDLYVKWNEYNVKDRDFSKLIMWDGALFRLNFIKDFDSDKAASCKVELIKVLDAKKRIGKQVGNTSQSNSDIATDFVSSPYGTGEDTGVIGTVPNNVLIDSKLIRG